MKKRAILVILAIVVVIAGITVYRWWSGVYGGPVTATGTVEATTVKVNARSAGEVEQMLVAEGNTVKVGQQLGGIKRNDLVAQRERDAMAVASAQARWQDLINGPRSQELTAAAAAVEQARINVTQSEADYKRAQSLYAQGALPASELEKAQTNLGVRQEQLRSSQAQMQNLQAGSREQSVEAAWAELERAKAVLKASDALLADLKLLSPLNGMVLERYFEPGEFAALGAALYQIADLQHLWVKVYIPTDELPRIKVGQQVTCTVSGSDKEFTGQVEKINAHGEYTPKSIQTKNERANVVYGVKVSLVNTEGILKPGLPIDVVFTDADHD